MHLKKKTIRRKRTETRSVTVYLNDGSKVVFKTVRDYLKARRRIANLEFVVVDKMQKVIHRVDGPAIEYSDKSREIWVRNGKKHNDNGPAVSLRNHKEWYIDGERHRIDGPAIEYGDGSKEWWVDDKLHRENGPAVENISGSVEYWWKNYKLNLEEHEALSSGHAVVRVGDRSFFFESGNNIGTDISEDHEKKLFIYDKINSSNKLLIHCADGPAIFRPNGAIEWIQNGVAHRIDGPAVISEDGSEFWYRDGKLHREDGPALTLHFKDGDERFKLERWYKDGKFFRKNGPVELITDTNGNTISKIYVSKEDGILLLDLEEERDMNTSEQLEHLTSTEALSYDLLMLTVMGFNGSMIKIACSHEAFAQDAIDEDGSLYIDGSKYIEPHNENTHINGKVALHSFNGQPALSRLDGHKEWRHMGMLHNDQGPAIIRSDGTKEWWLEGMRHREDGPAIEYSDGKKEWWVDGNRTDQPKQSIAVSVKVKDSFELANQQANHLIFFSQEEYENACYRDKLGRYKIRVANIVDTFIHSDEGPAIKYSDGREAYLIDGVLTEKHVISQLKKRRAIEDAKVILRSEGREAVYCKDIDELNSIIVEDVDNRYRFKDTGELVSNRFEPAIIYKDGTETCLLQGIRASSNFLIREDGSFYEDNTTFSWEYEGYELSGKKFTAQLMNVDSDPTWNINVTFDNTDFVVHFDVKYSDINWDNLGDFQDKLHNHTFDRFRNYAFANMISGVLKYNGPRFFSKNKMWKKSVDNPYKKDDFLFQLDEIIAQMKEQEALDGHYGKDQKDEKIGFGLPLACFAIASLAGLAGAKRKKTKKLNVKEVLKEKEEVVPVGK